MYHAYVMGIDDSIYDLENQGFIIEHEWDNFKVSFAGRKNSEKLALSYSVA